LPGGPAADHDQIVFVGFHIPSSTKIVRRIALAES
jgi:hypothetical protein